MKDPGYSKYLEKFHLEVCVVFHHLFILCRNLKIPSGIVVEFSNFEACICIFFIVGTSKYKLTDLL